MLQPNIGFTLRRFFAEPDEILFLSGTQRTISPISRRPIFTKFEHNMSIGVAMKTFGTEFETFAIRGRFKKRKNLWKILTSCDFRLP